ncbi:unnamed protein product [Rhizoctonia solani]|uniref:DNA-directed RNA polymerase RBP11-like dimerisation domain-containing protein n=1 Tax=Rhizoctonia solani TaxID=456999 RepID=A0A8H3A1D3_9AGAM|nr:unnamed protein product [Rhizoctonia solani]
MAEVKGIVDESEKIILLKGWTKSAATYCIMNESHTIGNSLRWMLMKNPKVEFCGYSSTDDPVCSVASRLSA